jgi:iron complex outermembrane receptor protein
LYGQSRTYGGPEQLSEAVNDAYVDVTLRGGFRATSGWSVIAYVENVTDEVFYDGVAQGAAGCRRTSSARATRARSVCR